MAKEVKDVAGATEVKDVAAARDFCGIVMPISAIDGLNEAAR